MPDIPFSSMGKPKNEIVTKPEKVSPGGGARKKGSKEGGMGIQGKKIGIQSVMLDVPRRRGT